MDERTLAVKMLKAGTFPEFVKSLENLPEESSTSKDSASNNPPDFKPAYDFRTVRQLATNRESYSFRHLRLNCEKSFILVKLLIRSGKFFVNEAGEPESPEESDVVKVGAALIGNTMKLHFNPFRVLDGNKPQTVGSGLYPATSFINHSCNPNMRFFFIGRDIMMRTILPVAPGEELTISYISEFFQKPKFRRMEMLSNYHFVCSCEACTDDWPLYVEIPTMGFKCLNCKKPLPGILTFCDDCKTTTGQNDDAVLDLYKEDISKLFAYVAMTTHWHGDVVQGKKIDKDTYRMISEGIEHYYEHVQLPCRNLMFLQNLLCKAFWDGL